MKKLLVILAALSFVGCAQKADKANKEKKIQIDVMDVQVEEKSLNIPLRVRCIDGYKSGVLQIGDVYKTINCEAGSFGFVHTIPLQTLKDNRKKKKDYVLRIRAFHEEKKSETLSQSLVILSNKDFQARLVINQSIADVPELKGTFSDLLAYGQCKQDSVVEVEIFDDFRGVSLEEETLKCGETGFSYSSRRPGRMKPGMRLLIREMKAEKPVSSFEVVLFN